MTTKLPYSHKLYVPANRALRVRLDNTGDFVLIQFSGRNVTVSGVSEIMLENVIKPDDVKLPKRKGSRQ